MQKNSDSATVHPAWFDTHKTAPVTGPQFESFRLPVLTWPAEHGVCLACRNLEYPDAAMICTKGVRYPRRVWACIDMRAPGGDCGSGGDLFEAKAEAVAA